MTDRSGDGDDRPVLAASEVSPAAGTARAQVTYDHLESSDPVHPIPDGGFWGAFMSVLEARWRRTQREFEDAQNTFDSEDAEGQTKLVTDGGQSTEGTAQSSGEVSHVICGACMIRHEGGACPNCGSEQRWHETR